MNLTAQEKDRLFMLASKAQFAHPKDKIELEIDLFLKLVALIRITGSPT